MVGNAAPPPRTEPYPPTTLWDLVKTIGVLILTALTVGATAIGFLVYMITNGSFFN